MKIQIDYLPGDSFEVMAMKQHRKTTRTYGSKIKHILGVAASQPTVTVNDFPYWHRDTTNALLRKLAITGKLTIECRASLGRQSTPTVYRNHTP